MREHSLPPGSPYLARASKSLYEACQALGKDDNGKACAACPIRAVCAAQRLKHAQPRGIAA